MNMYNYIMITVDELWLKGKNQPFYVKVLKNHIQYILKKYKQQEENNLADVQLFRKMERFFIQLNNSVELSVVESLLKDLSLLPGISHIIPCMKIDLTSSIDSIGSNVLELLLFEDKNKLIEAVSLQGNHTSADISLSRNKQRKINAKREYTFAINTKRVHKKFPFQSIEINRKIGGVILEKYSHLQVNLTSPKLIVNIRILRDGIYIYNRFLLGQGGLPIGTSGRAITLLSGGFDSPVASYLMAKRGVAQDFLFFFAKDKVQKEVKEKILALSKVLSRFQMKSSLYIVNSIEIQKVIKETSIEAYRTLLLRHFMQRTAEKLSQKNQAVAIITGDSLGQVASQTIHNLSALDRSSQLPVLRPLIGYNKKDIISISRIIETHDISVLPHDDACAMFAPRHPILKPDVNYWNEYISKYHFDDIISASLEDAEIIELT